MNFEGSIKQIIKNPPRKKIMIYDKRFMIKDLCQKLGIESGLVG